ncbi:hypothetical protein PTKIN_Ptkin19aG0007100 [Pterospermum kingtungense]
MAFWGTEVKPGRPFTHAPLNGRLHLSQATLGMGNASQKCIVQCNVGNKSPVFMCCLFPDKSECCQLNLEFEESEQVVFSVIGPRTVHLTGYYLSHHKPNADADESESYGEDIGETDTERSENSEESEYGGSFINDDEDDLQIMSVGSGSNEESLNLKKSTDGQGRRKRLRKKYQLSESENDDNSCQQNDITTPLAAVEVLDSEYEDTLPISSLCMGKHVSNGGKADVEEKSRKNNETEDNAIMLDKTNTAIDVKPKRNEEKQKRVHGVDDNALMKSEELPKEERFPEADHDLTGKLVLEQNELASKEECKHDDLLLAATQTGLEDGGKLKRKRKEHVKEKICKDNASEEDEGQKSGSNFDSVTDLDLKETQKQVNDKKSKKKKRCKKKEDGDVVKMEHERNGSVVEMDSKNANENKTQLSNGIIIEELEVGKPDGKIASLGKKVCIHYIGKLKDSGEVFESSSGKALTKFRLGGKNVPELWTVGLDGMLVGGKRRLTVPPSMSYRNEGASEAWLVFDVELLKIK